LVRILVGTAKILVGLVSAALVATVFGLVLIMFLPWRRLRIRSCHWVGKYWAKTLIWLSGCSVSLEGEEHLDPDRPAIYISNHTSPLDIFLGMAYAPFYSVGVAKKEIIFYPFFGFLYLLSGHLLIDRSRSAGAVAKVKGLAELVRRWKLNIFVWPEGTRSRTGQLLPFKKGVAHLAIQTGLPVVPMVVKGAHKSWPKGAFLVRGVPVHIEVLPPVDISGWTSERVGEAVAELHRMFVERLPEDQRPVADKTEPDS